MLRIMPIFILLLGLALLSTPVYAGDWAKGYGETVTIATENSLKAAKAAVVTRGTGCIGRKNGDDTRLAPKEQGLWVVETYYSHHNGSCGKMAAFFILTHTITDLDKYRKEYIPQVLPFIAKYGGEVVVASFDAEPLQGDPAKGVVVLRFPSEQAVRDFVNDPEYKPVKEIRLAITTNANAVLAPEFQMPES
jgi:uncharacterized protein (DUF1330 family)